MLEVTPLDLHLFAIQDRQKPVDAPAGFGLIGNIGAIVGPDRLQFGSALELRKATSQEVPVLRELYRQYLYVQGNFELPNPFEETMPGKKLGLGPEPWRYHVLASSKAGSDYMSVFLSSILTCRRLSLGPFVYQTNEKPSEISIGSGNCDQDYFRTIALGRLDFDTITEDHGRELVQIWNKLQDFSDTRIALQKSLSQFQQLDAIPSTSTLLFLGYISILESLVTHKPEPTDPYDSLTRQVKKKMQLIDNRLQRIFGEQSSFRLRYDLFQSKKTPEQLWGLLYSLRSTIAHGREPDFSGAATDENGKVRKGEGKGEFFDLRSLRIATEFMRCASKSVMRLALEDADLVALLHEC